MAFTLGIPKGDVTRRGWSTSVAGRDFASVHRAQYVRASEYWTRSQARQFACVVLIIRWQVSFLS
eukprot:6756802-Prymnesium_polylepis.1